MDIRRVEVGSCSMFLSLVRHSDMFNWHSVANKLQQVSETISIFVYENMLLEYHRPDEICIGG